MYRITENDKEATIFLNEDELYGDVNTIRQIRQMIRDPSVEHARIMPDCHYANSCCVGFTSRLTPRVVPRFIGGDIGCGVTVHPLGPIANRLRLRAARICANIRSRIPMGDAILDDQSAPGLTEVSAMAKEQCQAFVTRYNAQFGTSLVAPAYDKAWLDDLMHRTRADVKRTTRQLGTLGGGNHFVELNQGDGDAAYVSVHSGSRGLGQAICRYHQDIITAGTKPDWTSYEKESRRMKKSHKDPKVRAVLDGELQAKYLNVQQRPKYLEGDEAHAYYFDMIFAQCYARHNRRLMIQQILNLLNVDEDITTYIDSTHNYIDFQDMIWRKGAVRARAGELLVVALNMRDGLIIVRGKGNLDWNQSAPHGAGRKVPRNEARRHTTMREFEASMAAIHSDSINLDTLDESPAMYKDGELVMARSQDTCEIVQRLTPIINMKGF